MLDFITTNPVLVACIAIIIIAVVISIYINRKDVLLKSALYIVAKVEEEWGSDMGRIKFAEAYTYLRKQYPLVTFLIPENVLKNIIEEALTSLKEILATKASKASKELEEQNKTE